MLQETKCNAVEEPMKKTYAGSNGCRKTTVLAMTEANEASRMPTTGSGQANSAKAAKKKKKKKQEEPYSVSIQLTAKDKYTDLTLCSGG